MTDRREFERLIRKRMPLVDFELGVIDGAYIVHAIQSKWEGWMMRQDQIDELRKELQAEKELLDFLADREQGLAYVQLPIGCVQGHIDSMRDAIRCAMEMHRRGES